jgi:hypothetical protein
MQYLKKILDFSLNTKKGPMLMALMLGPLIAFLLRFFFFKDEVLDFKDKNVFLAGAAPTAKKPLKKYDKYVGLSHASKLLVDTFNVQCDLNVISGGITPGRIHANIVNQLLVHGLKSSLENINYSNFIKYKKIIKMNNWTRAFILNYVCKTNYLDNIIFGKKTSVSKGGWTVAFLIFLGVKSIHITGMNMRSGTNNRNCRYFDGSTIEEKDGYDISVFNKDLNRIKYHESPPRDHVSSDLCVLSSVSLIYTNRIQITTDESELESVISPNLC